MSAPTEVFVFSELDADGAFRTERVLRAMGDEAPLRVAYFPAGGRAADGRPRFGKALELAHHARTLGAEGVVREALFRAFREQRAIDRIDVLAEIAGECGLDPVGARIALDIDAFAAAVAAEHTAVASVGITVVPTVVFGRGPRAVTRTGALTRADVEQALRECATDASHDEPSASNEHVELRADHGPPDR